MNLAQRLRLAAALFAIASSATAALAQTPAGQPGKGRQSAIMVIQKIDPQQQTIVVVRHGGGNAIQTQQAIANPSKGPDNTLLLLVSDKTLVRLLGKAGHDRPIPASKPEQGGKERPTLVTANASEQLKPTPVTAQAAEQPKPPTVTAIASEKPKPTPATVQATEQPKPAPIAAQAGEKLKPTSATVQVTDSRPNPAQGGEKPRPILAQFDKLKIDQVVQIVYQQQDDGKFEEIRIDVLPVSQNP
jgi:hypothetical protein